MFTLIYNETKKLLFRKKTLVVFVGFLLLMGVLAFAMNRESERAIKESKPEQRIARLNEQKKYIQRSIADRETELKNDPKALEQFKQNREEELKQIDVQISRYEEIIKKGGQVDWREDLKERIKNTEMSLNDGNMPQEFKESQKLELERLQYLQKHDIKPMDNNQFDAPTFIMVLFSILGTVFLVVGVLVFACDMVSGECTPPTLKFLLIQPVSRGKVLFSKFISVTLAAVVLIVSAELLFFTVIGLTKGFGNMSYPVFSGTLYKFDMANLNPEGLPNLVQVANSTKIITLGQNLLQMFMLQILFIVACSAFAFLISTLFKSSMVSMALGIVSVITVTVLTNAISSLKKIAHYLFTSYGDVGMILEGSKARSFMNPSLTTSNAIIVLVAWTVACYLISHIIFTKKDILI